MTDNVVIMYFVKPLSMTFIRTSLKGMIYLIAFFFMTSCQKESTPITNNPFINNADPTLVQDWTNLSIDLSNACNGFNDLISSRAHYYMALTMYEALLPGLKNYQTLQVRLANFQTTLPVADQSKNYNWMIVSNHALAIVATELFKASGTQNLDRINQLRDKYVKIASNELDEEIIRNSKELGNEIGWKIRDYSLLDGRSDAHLNNYPVFSLPSKEGCWIPTPPDYSAKLLLPYWGATTPALMENVLGILPSRLLLYNTSQTSIMFSEAVEVYNMTNNLSAAQRENYEYWNQAKDHEATALNHNLLLMLQLCEDKDLRLDQTLELYVRMAITIYDGYILSWKTKYTYNLLRPSSYIKQNINRYFIPDYSCNPAPDFVSENALVYSACSELLGSYFGYRTSFMDYTQSSRSNLRESKRYFESFNIMAKEAAYVDLLSAAYFRTSIDIGFQMGFDLSQNVLNLKLQY